MVRGPTNTNGSFQLVVTHSKLLRLESSSLESEFYHHELLKSVLALSTFGHRDHLLKMPCCVPFACHTLELEQWMFTRQHLQHIVWTSVPVHQEIAFEQVVLTGTPAMRYRSSLSCTQLCVVTPPGHMWIQRCRSNFQQPNSASLNMSKCMLNVDAQAAKRLQDVVWACIRTSVVSQDPWKPL